MMMYPMRPAAVATPKASGSSCRPRASSTASVKSDGSLGSCRPVISTLGTLQARCRSHRVAGRCQAVTDAGLTRAAVTRGAPGIPASGPQPTS